MLRGAFEVRIARVDGSYGEPLTLTMSGYALTTSDRVSSVEPMIGDWQQGSTTREGVNAFGDVSITPWVETTQPVVFGRVYAALVVLGGHDSVRTDGIGVELDGPRSSSPGRIANRMSSPWSSGQDLSCTAPTVGSTYREGAGHHDCAPDAPVLG